MDNLEPNSGAAAEADFLGSPQALAAMNFINAFAASAPYDYYGRDPHDVLPPLSTWRPFTPRYIAILYFELRGGWDIRLNHACFEIAADSTPDSRRDLAVRILKIKTERGIPLGHEDLRGFGTYEHQLPDAGHDPARPYDSAWFKDFNFYSQNELFIFLDDDDIQLNPSNLLSFKPFGVGPMPKWPNFSYFHAREVPEPELDGLTGKMIRVENHATKEDGTAIEWNENRSYSMDIRFQVAGGDEGLITMLIDPDTGNGGGNEP